MDGITIRPFATLEEYQACTEMQEEVWGRGFKERVSAAILMIANKLGGLAAGAYDESGGLAGFVFGLTGVREGEVVHWSDMLAVREDLRDHGLGTRLKHYQREVILGRGIGRMHWTFDPLQGRNARVNFAKLGIVTREYVRDMYGDTDSPLHRGVGTDRLVATWQMDSPRVTRRLAGEEMAPAWAELEHLPRILPALTGASLPAPGDPQLGLEAPRLLLSIPRHIEDMMRDDLPLALAWRQATRAAFTHYLSRGYEAQEFVGVDPLSHYLLVRDPEEGVAP